MATTKTAPTTLGDCSNILPLRRPLRHAVATSAAVCADADRNVAIAAMATAVATVAVGKTIVENNLPRATMSSLVNHQHSPVMLS